jgi:prophage antirepressor-like protein
MNELQRIFNYHGNQVRTIIKDGEPWFVAADTCDILAIVNASQAVQRLDDDEKGICLTDTLGGVQEMITVNEPGLYTLIFSSRKKAAKTFKRWITHEVIPSIRKTGRYETGMPQSEFHPWADFVSEHLRVAKAIADTTGVKPGIAFAAAINQAQLETGRDLTAYQKLLPPADHETGYLTSTDIGKRIGISAVKANKTLAVMGLIARQEDEKQRKHWRITDTGKQYGEEFPFVRNGHSGYQIRWNEEILRMLPEVV